MKEGSTLTLPEISLLSYTDEAVILKLEKVSGDFTYDELEN
jgi:hypothetical protein